jgi:hypothetical protein
VELAKYTALPVELNVGEATAVIGEGAAYLAPNPEFPQAYAVTLGEFAWTIIATVPAGLKHIHAPEFVPVGKVVGFANCAPKPVELLKGKPSMYGDIVILNNIPGLLLLAAKPNPVAFITPNVDIKGINNPMRT